MAYDPFENLESRAGVTLTSHTGPQDPWGEVWGHVTLSTLLISLRRGMASHRARCTLAHELAHLERGPIRRSQVAGEERAIELIVAKRLIAPDAFDELMGPDGPPTLVQVHEILRIDFEHFRTYVEWRLGDPGADVVQQAPLDGLSVRWPPSWQVTATSA